MSCKAPVISFRMTSLVLTDTKECQLYGGTHRHVTAADQRLAVYSAMLTSPSRELNNLKHRYVNKVYIKNKQP